MLDDFESFQPLQMAKITGIKVRNGFVAKVKSRALPEKPKGLTVKSISCPI